MKKSRRADPLQELANDILKGHAPVERPRSRNAQVHDFYARGVPTDAQRANGYTPPPRPSGFVKSIGPGGMVFDFGHLTGNDVADRATALLNHFNDPVEAQTAVDQRAAIAKAFVDYSQLGEHGYAQRVNLADAMRPGTIHPEHAANMNKGLDQAVVELVQREGLGPGYGGGSGSSGPGTQGDFNKATIRVGNEVITGQSETDAAVIEMMKSMGTDLTDDQGFVPEG